MSLSIKNGKRVFPTRRSRCPAFTLVELLVVIAVIGILAALLLTAVSKVKTRAQTTSCMNNVRQVVLAWQMYSGENNDRLVNNFGPNQTRQDDTQGIYRTWAANVMDWSRDEQNTNLLYAWNGLLGTYIKGASRTYKCPVDNFLSQIQRQAGWTARIRSVSLNAFMGRLRVNPDLSAAGRNDWEPSRRQFLKASDIPAPAQTFALLEEHADSIDDGIFFISGVNRGSSDIPASYHNSSGNISFADGHCETHKWRGIAMTPKVEYRERRRLPDGLDQWSQEDYTWLTQRASVQISPSP